jgi:hypothetical protein
MLPDILAESVPIVPSSIRPVYGQASISVLQRTLHRPFSITEHAAPLDAGRLNHQNTEQPSEHASLKRSRFDSLFFNSVVI